MSCIVPCCKVGNGNYVGPKYRTIRFPKSEKWKEIWLKKVNRFENPPSNPKKMIICLKHFIGEKFSGKVKCKFQGQILS